MRTLKYLLAASFALFLGQQSAQAAAIQYEMFFSMEETFAADLSTAPLIGGGTSPTAPVPGMAVFTMARLGMPGSNYADSYSFRVGSAADFTLSVMVGEVPGFPMIGMEDVNLSLYVDGDGNGIAGTGGDTLLGQNTPGALLGGLSVIPGINYVLQVSGSLLSTAIFGWYTGVIDLSPVVAAVPVPPALLLGLTGIGALFGFAGIQRRRAPQTA